MTRPPQPVELANHVVRLAPATTADAAADVEGEVHADGEIWSRALWDIRTALGDTEANRIIINAQFSFKADTSFAAAAATTVSTAQHMYGSGAAAAVTAAFHARGIL